MPQSDSIVFSNFEIKIKSVSNYNGKQNNLECCKILQSHIEHFEKSNSLTVSHGNQGGDIYRYYEIEKPYSIRLNSKPSAAKECDYYILSEITKTFIWIEFKHQQIPGTVFEKIGLTCISEANQIIKNSLPDWNFHFWYFLSGEYLTNGSLDRQIKICHNSEYNCNFFENNIIDYTTFENTLLGKDYIYYPSDIAYAALKK